MMLVDDAIIKIKSAGQDSSFKIGADRCIEHINRAIKYIASLVIAGKYPAITNTIELSHGDELPSNLMKLCGQYPMCITNNVCEFFDEDEIIKIRYFALPEEVDKPSDEMPFKNDAFNDLIVQCAIIYAKHENSDDVNVENTVMQEIQQAVAVAMGAGE